MSGIRYYYIFTICFFSVIIVEKMICYLTMDILQNQDPQSLSPVFWDLNGVYHTTLFRIFKNYYLLFLYKNFDHVFPSPMPQ